MADHEYFTIEQIEEALKNSKGLISLAAVELGCVFATVTNYIKRYKTLQKSLEEINETNLDFCESKLLQQINEGNTTAIIFYLKFKGKRRGYCERQEFVQSGEITITWPKDIDVDKL